MKKLILLFFGACLLFISCEKEQNNGTYKWRDEWREDYVPEVEDDVVGKPRYVWIDASANFAYYGNDETQIAADCRRLAEIGFTDIIVDVRPNSGDVLFKSTVAPELTRVTAWTSSGFGFLERTADFDYLQTFIVAGHRAGLRVNAAINTMVGGYRTAAGDYGMMFDHPELKSWGTVDNLSGGLTNTMDNPSNGPRFLDPANAEVQKFLLDLLAELAAYKGLDGIVLDRCRYSDACMDAGYTDAAKAAFAEYIGGEVTKWPIFTQGQVFIPNSPSKIQKQWLGFRVKTIHDFIEKASARVHEVNPAVRFGVYVGAWFSEYYRSGVNWTSPNYKLKTSESAYGWVLDDYQSYGFADHLDFIFLGAYAGTSSIYGTGEWTMQGFAQLGKKRLAGAVPFYPGPDIGNSTGFTEGGQQAIIPTIIDVLMQESSGMFIFDLCHIRSFDYWDAVKQGFDAYLATVETP